MFFEAEPLLGFEVEIMNHLRQSENKGLHWSRAFIAEITTEAWPQIDIPFLVVAFRFLKSAMWVLQELVYPLPILIYGNPWITFLPLEYFFMKVQTTIQQI